MELSYIKVYRDFIDIVRELDNGARGRLFMAILEYANDEETDDLTGAEKIAFLTMKGQIDRDRATYSDISDKRRDAGKRGAEKRWNMENPVASAILPIAKDSKNSKCHQDKDKGKDKDQDQDKDKDQDEDKGKDQDKDEDKDRSTGDTCALRFKPPSAADVKAYCRERGNHVDAEKFVDYYAARGWKYKGGTAMKDWRAAVRTWERGDSEKNINSLTDNPFLKILMQEGINDG